ncbi:MAG: hypothetical protein F6K11_25600, partial [Leptolyngbya sp. SIO3F4]|nr:hypothetical protein [Leptolyngbya sp. SIO3F4]
MSNLFAFTGFDPALINSGSEIWSEAWLTDLLNPLVGISFYALGDVGRWSGLGISESLLLNELNYDNALLVDNYSRTSLSLSAWPSETTQPVFYSGIIDPLTGQFSQIGNLSIAAQSFHKRGKTVSETVSQSIRLDSHTTTTDVNTPEQTNPQLINSDNDNSPGLTSDRRQPDGESPILTLALQADTGQVPNDGITQKPTLVGTVSDQNEIVRVNVHIDENNLDINEQLQPDGSFTIDEFLLRDLVGGPLVDGRYEISVTAEDVFGNVSEPAKVSMTIDRTPAELSLTSPLANGTHSAFVHLLGKTDETGHLSATLNETTTFNVDVTDNTFDQVLQTHPLTDGAYQLVLYFKDVAGNVTKQAIDFDVTNSAFVIGAADTTSWVATTNDVILLAGGNSFATQAQVPLRLGQSEGSRRIRFAVDATFNANDETVASSDTLAVYLVSNTDLSQTLLDNGIPGTPVFSLTGETAEFTPGLVTYDGQFVEIDLTALDADTEGALIFQLLNQDGVTGSRIHISQLTNTVNSDGSEAIQFEETDTVVSLGGKLALESLLSTSSVKPVFSNIRFDSQTGKYTAHLQVRNTGNFSISRQVAAVFDKLPEGINLQTVSGTDINGNPYVNFYNAIRPGGLASGELSDAISITISNPEQLQLILTPQIMVGGPNQPPVFDPIKPIEVMPGQRIDVSLNAIDPNGDRVTYSLRTDANLPTGILDGAGKLSFTPTPNDIGTYTFTVIATDGGETVEQTVTLNVVPDPITTTRISGQVLDINGNPLTNLPIELGRLQTVT